MIPHDYGSHHIPDIFILPEKNPTAFASQEQLWQCQGQLRMFPAELPEVLRRIASGTWEATRYDGNVGGFGAMYEGICTFMYDTY